MSHFLDRLRYFSQPREAFAGGHGELRTENRQWEDGYRNRWQHDKIVRSTHGVNCTGSCSWKIYVKGGVVTWETQQTDYPRTRAGMPNHEPRGCSRGASYSWYLYSANRLKYPMVRGHLLRRWREARKTMQPVEAWAAICADPAAKDYKAARGLGGFARVRWDEALEIIAAANVHTVKQHGPDRVVGFSPIPAMSMVSYASGARYLSLIGGTLLSFYDWYCDLPPSSPQTWGEQTDVPESADWYNSGYIIAWGSNVPQTRTPDAHFFVEARYNGTQVVAITPDYSEVAKLSDLWLHPKQGTDAALAMAMGHVILREFFLDRQAEYFQDYCRRYTDLPLLVTLRRDGARWVPDRYLRASDFADALGSPERAEWKTVGFDADGKPVVPHGSIGFRWPGKDSADHGKWNLEQKSPDGREIALALTQIDRRDDVLDVAFPYFGGTPHAHFPHNDQDGDVLLRRVPARKLQTRGGEVMVATAFDLLCAHYGLDRGLGGGCAASYADDVPYTPAWQQAITGVPAEQAIAVARAFASNAEKTRGRSMVIIGAGMNHWFHQDMNYRSIINILMLCGTVGISGGGWAHYVGQEKLRPQTGWTVLAFALDWVRPPRQMNGTSFFYAHSDQWRYEKLDVDELLSPLAPRGKYGRALIDCNVRAERMGWLPSAPQLGRNPLEVARAAERSGMNPKDYVVTALKSGDLRLACEDPDNPANFPRNLFIWRSNLFGSSGKGHEYFLRHFLGTRHGLQGKDLGEDGGHKPEEVAWHTPAPEGKLDLVVTLDFRMSTSCLYSDVVLPTASWYEKNDLNTSDMHPFIHPLSAAVDPVYESKSDWEIFKAIAKRFSELAPGHLGVERDVVLTPILHDTPGEIAQPFEVRDWKKGECDLVPGVTAPNITLVERDYPATYARFTALGPLLDKLGNGGKGIAWNTEEEVHGLAELNYTVADGPAKGRPRIDSDIDAAEVILHLAPETNGHVAVKAWAALSKITGRDHTHLARAREDEKIRFRDIQAQPRKIISSPTWSGIESEHVSYNAGYTNVHELIPWRTLSGRQQFYQDHPWLRDFGEGFALYRPPIDTRTVAPLAGKRGNGHPEIVLNFITPHQKWGIHSTYTDNLIMLTLSRGGPIVWISEVDARRAGIADNDWIELYNVNGALTARAVVSQRVHEGMCLMYHAQEKIVNVPGSEITGMRGGIHNSVTRAVIKPTHMIGGYAQLSYGFNYYGTVGSNRDEFVIVRKMAKVDWMDRAQRAAREAQLHAHRA
ncbi:nitrate reductase, alpha subunit [Mizugakiibacter sediminis]|uniref:nitrate reductase (quinone) n=1 Tax=Mizugakiibacter sediminis TaxID=1475481 RepID=A0A0K8QQ74_9GAMM|nr:nitrate reductase subunit alpha [Mizugakiibacter sediminis]GAP67065.1 nitrate reductase, alpha subunit [Mizugakiibacter sediminis]